MPTQSGNSASPLNTPTRASANFPCVQSERLTNYTEHRFVYLKVGENTPNILNKASCWDLQKSMTEVKMFRSSKAECLLRHLCVRGSECL